MDYQNLLKNPQTNWKYILIIAILAFLVGGGILWWLHRQEIEMPEIEIPKREVSEEVEVLTNWKAYKNEEYGFEFEYPGDWEILVSAAEEMVEWAPSPMWSLLIQLRPQNWEEVKKLEAPPIELGPGVICERSVSDYPLFVEIQEVNYSQYLLWAGVEKLEKEEAGIAKGKWVIRGGKGALTEAQEVIIASQKAIRGERLVGTYYRNTETCSGGYAGLAAIEEVLLRSPGNQYSLSFVLQPEGLRYLEIFNQLLSIFRFLE